MKNRIAYCLAAAVCFGTISCKKELEPQESSAPVETAAIETPATPAPTEMTAAPSQTASPQMQTVSAQQTPQQQPAPVAKGMNPAHGQPGHRCDIAVGAPLNSPPGKTATPVAQQPGKAIQVGQPQKITPSAPAPQGAPSILNAPASTTVTAPGMNPPHGQEGHRCDIAVGAPLAK